MGNHTIKTALLFSLFTLFTFINCKKADEKKNDKGLSINKKHNILFISIDDLRTKINSYGDDKMITPNIDKLAKEGIQFKITQLVMKDDKALEGRHKENPNG